MKTILILEDNVREMERLVKIVREQGAQNEVICAVNLEQAYHMAMEKSIDLFLLDIILDPRTSGDASGMKFADHIREVERYHLFARHGRALTGVSPEHARIVGSV